MLSNQKAGENFHSKCCRIEGVFTCLETRSMNDDRGTPSTMTILRAKRFSEVKEAKLNCGFIYFTSGFITLPDILLLFSFKIADSHVRFYRTFYDLPFILIYPAG